jgi:hypothetical protein
MNPPDSQPSGREFGELVGEVRAVSKQLADMQQRNSSEHASVIAAIGEVRRDLNTKASKTWVKEIADRTDKLESIKDEGSGAAKLIRVMQGAVVAGVAILAFVIGKGGVG